MVRFDNGKVGLECLCQQCASSPFKTIWQTQKKYEQHVNPQNKSYSHTLSQIFKNSNSKVPLMGLMTGGTCSRCHWAARCTPKCAAKRAVGWGRRVAELDVHVRRGPAGASAPAVAVRPRPMAQ